MKLGIAVRYVKFSRQTSSVKTGLVRDPLYLRASAGVCRSFPHLFSSLGEIRCTKLHVTSLSNDSWQMTNVTHNAIIMQADKGKTMEQSPS
jgi:hypothetical protein